MKLQIKRLWSQFLIFFSANLGAFGIKTGFCFPFFYCHACPSASGACPLRAIEKSVYNNSFSFRLFIYPLLILGFFGAFGACIDTNSISKIRVEFGVILPCALFP